MKTLRHLPLFILLSAFIGLSGCSTLKSLNPFSKNDSEDYNALTYGEQTYQNNPRDSWVKSGDRNSSDRTRNPSSDENQGDRKANRNSRDDTYYGKNDSALDPTDDSVRQQIETGRGLAVSSYNRGDRATRTDFYDNSPNDGSLWSNEIDSNYFFTKGKIRAMGDIISVKMEEPLVKQVAEEVKKTLSPTEQEVEMALYLKNNPAAKDNKDVLAYRNVTSDDLKNSESEEVKDKMEKAVRWSQVDLTPAIGLTPNEELRAEIIDRFQNGNYKIRAVKRVLYRGSSKLVSFVAVAPANDFDEKDVINSGKLYEHKIKVAR